MVDSWLSWDRAASFVAVGDHSSPGVELGCNEAVVIVAEVVVVVAGVDVMEAYYPGVDYFGVEDEEGKDLVEGEVGAFVEALG